VPQAVASFIVPERNTAFMTNLPPEKVTVIDGRESMGAKGQCQLCESARVWAATRREMVQY